MKTWQIFILYNRGLTQKKTSLNTLVEYYMEISLKNVLRNTVMKEKIDYNVLCFRTYVISKTNKILYEDAIAVR